jgi:O-antigen/teichoic acid export membrane protein
MKIPAIKGFDEESFQKYFKNTGWLMFGKILSMIVGFMVARHLKASLFGELSFADAFTTIIAAVGTLGLDSFIIREVINEPNKKEEILGTSLFMRLIINIFLVPITVAIYLVLHQVADKPGNPLTWIILIMSFASFFKSFNVIDSYFQSQVASKYVVQVQNICVILSAITKVLLVLFSFPLIYFAASLTFDSFLLAAGLVYMYHKRGLSMKTWTFNMGRAKGLLKQSLPLIISSVMVSIYMKIDTVMLKSIGSAAVGVYSAAAKISEAWFFIPMAIVSSVFPALINARKTDMKRYNKRLINLYDLLIYISLPVAIFISFFGTTIITLLYGNSFEGAGPMLSIHIWSGIFVFLGSASSMYLLAEGYTNISWQRTAVGAVVNILLNFWLIPLYGGIGTSIATLVACFITTFYIILIPKTREQGILMLKSLFLIHLFQKISTRGNTR